MYRDRLERYLADLLNGPDPSAAADALLTEEFRFSGPGNTAGIHGPAAFAAFQGVMRTALDGLRFELTEAIVEGDSAALVLRMTGRQVGPFAGVEPRGASVDLCLVDVLRFQGDRIAAITAYLDAADLRRQLEAGPGIAEGGSSG